MRKHLSNVKSRLEQLYSAKNYLAALEVMSAIDFREATGGDAGELAEMYLIQSRCYLRTGDYRAAQRKLRVSLKLTDGENDYSLLARQKYTLGQILHETGELDRALEEYTESYVYFRRIGDTERMLAPLETTAMIHFMKGDLHQASSVSERALRLAREASLAEDVTVSLLNLAQANLFLGRLATAVEQLELALSGSPDHILTRRGQTLKGITLVVSGQGSPAALLLRDALAFYRADHSTRDEVVCLEYLGLNEYYAGNYDKAKEYYDDILGRKEITASARAQTLRMLTDVYVAKAMWQQASETAVVAEAAIIKINERIELGALDRARGLISANAGEHDQARDYFDKSIRLLREIGARYELALSYLTCGRCDIFSRDERRYFLRRAHDLFTEMEVPKRVVEVDEALEGLGPRFRGGDRTGGGGDDQRGGDDKTGGGDNVRGRGDGKISGVDEKRRRLTLKSSAPSGNSQVVIAGSPCMRELMRTIARLAPTDLTVLLVGETGTGKDLLAQYLHRHSGRPGEFVTVNSAAIPNEMVEAELFGYAKGAFTGANKDKPGLFELADRGTFYLNEISSCTPEFQAKLLEVLESGMIRRLGETSRRRVDFRLIAASNHDLNRLIREERFRPDLFYRLREYQVALPPLQERREDFPELVHHFLIEAGCPQDGTALLAQCKRIAAQMISRPWPGNVRMLRAELRRLWFACDGDLDGLRQLAANRDELSQREELLYALRECGYNQSETARRLGVSEGTVRNRIKRFKIVL